MTKPISTTILSQPGGAINPPELLTETVNSVTGHRNAGHWVGRHPGLLSNQGEKSINFFFIMVP